jgi:LysR family transcriptional activator of mexEF-oprN operon
MANIDTTDLRDVDLNLLVAFEALMQTRSVTRAAQRLRVGQPSASHALKRLRELLDDPLFVRAPAGMTPTPRSPTRSGQF